MKRTALTGLALASSLLLSCLLTAAQAAGKLTLTSTDIAPGGRIAEAQIFNGFGCTGPNTSPALAWSGVPDGTKSFVVTVYDPDAPTGSGFWHWVLYNIPASTTSLPQGAGMAGKEPAGAVQSSNDFGASGYGGPCPPPGSKPHRYVFTVFAIKTDKLGVPDHPTNAVIGFVTRASMLGQASFTAKYGR